MGHGGEGRPGDSPKQALYKYVEGVGAQIALEKQGHAQMGDAQPRQQQDYPDGQFPARPALHGSSSGAGGSGFFSRLARHCLK